MPLRPPRAAFDFPTFCPAEEVPYPRLAGFFAAGAGGRDAPGGVEKFTLRIPEMLVIFLPKGGAPALQLRIAAAARLLREGERFFRCVARFDVAAEAWA